MRVPPSIGPPAGCRAERRRAIEVEEQPRGSAAEKVDAVRRHLDGQLADARLRRRRAATGEATLPARRRRLVVEGTARRHDAAGAAKRQSPALPSWAPAKVPLL